MAAAPLTVNEDREFAVKFLAPAFMTFDLAMLMKTSHKSSEVQSIVDLNKETNFTFGVVAGGSTEAFFQQSHYRLIRYKLQTSASVEEGVRRVRESSDDHPYIFIGEQYTLEYHASRKPCGLVVVRGNETVKEGEYRLAVRKQLGSEMVAKLETSLSKLNQTGRLDQLYTKWWIERSQCNGDASDTASSAFFTSTAAILVPLLLATLSRQ